MDLHEEFVEALQAKAPRRLLIKRISDILRIEEKSAYRRISGKINFTMQEIGLIAKEFNISLDLLMQQHDERIAWLPLNLYTPLNTKPMDYFFNGIDQNLDMLENVYKNDLSDPVEMGIICCTIPIEIFLYSPVITKFILLKWGYNFVGTEEFNNYSTWKVPDKIQDIHGRIKRLYKFDKSYYIWDNSITYVLANEIKSFHNIGIISGTEKNEIRDALKDLLSILEKILNGTIHPNFGLKTDIDFYISTQYTGFTGLHCSCAEKHWGAFHTNFNFCVINNDLETFRKLKKWIDSFKLISTRISGNGRIPRRKFFNIQYETIDSVLGYKR